MESLLILYALGVVPTFQWTYRNGREPYRRFDQVACLFATCAAAAWLLAVPLALLYRKTGR